MSNRALLLELTESYLKSLISEVSDPQSSDFDSFAPFGELGIDSFLVLKIIKGLESDFGTLPKTLLFENFTINDLAQYFVSKHDRTLREKFAEAMQEPIPIASEVARSERATSGAGVSSMQLAGSGKQPVDSRKALQKGPVFTPQEEAYSHPDLRERLGRILEQFKNEGSISRGTPIIAPWLFIDSERRGYFNCAQNQSILLAYAYTGPHASFPAIAEELLGYCRSNDLQLNLLTGDPIARIGDTAFSATPFGAIQRVRKLSEFTLQGGRMRRLRYQVSRFEKSGVCRTEEYTYGSDPKVHRNIASIIDQWCESKTMVNPLVYVAKEEILAGAFSAEHRIFLTYVDDSLQNVIIISPLSGQENGYLMDLEFYPPDMPLGGLEFAIVNLIEVLAAEACETLSLGATFGPKLSPSPNADQEVDRILDELRKQDIFNDGGNLQFKNKFRPDNSTIFLCRPVDSGSPDNVIDIIMMIADPKATRRSAPERVDSRQAGPQTAGKPEPAEGRNGSAILERGAFRNAKSGSGVSEQTAHTDYRLASLSDFGYNVLSLPDAIVDFDLKTDSWAELTLPAIDNQIRHLRSQLPEAPNVEESLRAAFPFTYFVLTTSGRAAEGIFCKCWPKKGVVLQNLLFPTWIFHQIDNGFTPRELPNPEVFRVESRELNKGELDWKSFEEHVNGSSETVAFVCVEVSDNAAGGLPVSIQHLRKLKTVLSTKVIPLIIDGTRILENAQLLAEQAGDANESIWQIAKEIFSHADAVTASLTKDFCVKRGGLIATNDADLAHELGFLTEQEGVGMDPIDRKLVALSLQNREPIRRRVLQRMEWVRRIWHALRQHGVPVVEPCGGHCVLIDVREVPGFANFDCPVASFLSWLYVNTGIRAAAHNAGMQKNTSLNSLVRLAIPVGLNEKRVQEIINRLISLFARMENITELAKDSSAAGTFTGSGARFRLQAIHNRTVPVADSRNRVSGTQEGNIAEERLDGIVTQRNAHTVEQSEVERKSGSFRTDRDEFPAIAIIGMAGRYPKARNLDELWDNLANGIDCIGDIPDSRAEQRLRNGKKYRGGFLEDVDRFDSLFFNISPREAEMLDPQERLFLEVAWEAIEDAGYFPEILSGKDGSRNIGVFVGAVWAMYQILGVEAKAAGSNVTTNSFLWSIANRVSYCLNLNGPSLTIDTACSSSLTAIYLACEAILRNECSSAIVGGVNLDLHQSKLDINSVGGALSEDGVCRSFGSGANGYVAGEGVGAIFLKPLAAAIADGDNIHGVIRSIAINHGGRTSGYTVPNPKAQSDLILSAIRKAQIDARTIGYIEAHGTGTELGDPIEIAGLSQAFEPCNVEKQTCAIGSIKSNIGHLEAAAGVVGVCKVLLQMKHRRLVPSLHSSKLNEFIDFENSPFYVEQEVEDWKRKEIDGIVFPLRAGVSSFGAGGANAHIILEEYVDDSALQLQERDPRPPELIFPLSAKTEAALVESARRLRAFLERDVRELTVDELQNVSYTLRAGRQTFEHRLAVIAGKGVDLVEKLTCFIEGKKAKGVLTGNAKAANDISRLLSQSERQAFTRMLSQTRDPQRFAQVWTDGLLTDWGELESAPTGKRISLPTYPFADKRHWAVATSELKERPLLPRNVLHPLLDSNASTFDRQRFRKTFHEREFFIRDHVVSDIPTLPGVAYLELARKAGEIATGRRITKIKNVLWISPLTLKDSTPTEAVIDLEPNGEAIHFEVLSERPEGTRQVYSQGRLCYAGDREEITEPEYIDIEAVRARCQKVTDGAATYPLFKSLGLNLGPSFQVLQDVFSNRRETLARLKLSPVRGADFADFILHPSLVDGSFQSVVAARLQENTSNMLVPYSIREVEIRHPLEPVCFCYATEVQDGKQADSRLSRMNILILDERGKILVKILESTGVPLSDLQQKPRQEQEVDSFATLYYACDLEAEPLPDKSPPGTGVGSVLLFDSEEGLAGLYRDRLRAAGDRDSRMILVQPGDGYEELGRDSYRIKPTDIEDYKRLLTALRQSGGAIDKICLAWTVRQLSNQGRLENGELERGVYSLLYLCKTLIEHDLQNKTHVVYLYSGRKDDPQPHNEAISGFAKTLHLENPKVSCTTLAIDREATDRQAILDAVLAEFHAGTKGAIDVRCEKNGRYVRKIRRMDPDTVENLSRPDAVAFKEKGVYLITGGAGGLGLLFAEFLSREYGARLILAGRSMPSGERESRLEALRSARTDVLFVQADVSASEDVANLLETGRARFGQINGIIHSAGVLRDSYIKNKTDGDMHAVLAPKIHGLIHLDDLTRDDDLDFFVMFSSLAALGGNAGQCDYAFANHFMDSFAHQRELRRAKGERSGKTLSLNWSIWADGGMKLDQQTELFFKQSFGIRPLGAETGIEALVKGLSSDRHQIAVLEGKREKVERAWGIDENAPPAPAPSTSHARSASPASAGRGSSEKLTALVQRELSRIVMDFLKLQPDEISLDKILLDLGFDSLGLTTFANAINEKYQTDITPVLFFEYPSIKEIAAYLCSEHSNLVQILHDTSQTSPVTRAPTPRTEPSAQTTEAAKAKPMWSKRTLPPGRREPGSDSSFRPESISSGSRFARQPIAIVGMSGVMPQSDDLEEFWNHLKDGEDLITVIPKDRWNWKDYEGDPLKEKNKCNSKWGGFMREVDKFDPLFFGISPREAEMMDPQQRIFLETVWKAIEDSGHKVSELSGTKTGLFVGVATNDYAELMNTHRIGLDGYTASGNSHSILVNRVSFLLNLRGPSAPLDTACSSSLVAVHRAIESIHTGSCEMAIVGGVQVMQSPAAYISFGMAGMLSDDGRCKTFDKRANGYVRGEGTGAIVLKPLSKVQADGDHIYALIRATAENHGGRVTMLTAPNPNAQAELLIDAYEAAQIDPGTVGYIECHGTGTSLGDPIEIQGLTKAFSELYKRHGRSPAETPHCGLSSVKTNIGHLETAAGIAGILKVLLSIKHRQIPASLHFEELNPYISLKGSPLYIVDKTRPWEPLKDEDGNVVPRRAGVSSFGFGGANAHVVLEEYLVPEETGDTSVEGPHLIMLSAKNRDRLRAYARIMLDHVERHPVDLRDFAYTLQVGRDAMAERLALVVDSVEQLAAKLRSYIDGHDGAADVYQGNVAENKEEIEVLNDREMKAVMLDKLVADRDYGKLSRLWTRGLEFDWCELYKGRKPKRASLPTYPFARERYWFSVPDDAQAEAKAAKPATIHPLLHRNTSVLHEQCYTSTFTGEEEFLTDCRFKGRCVLPAMAYLEMARAAIADAAPAKSMTEVLTIRNAEWALPLPTFERNPVCVALFEPGNDRIGFEIRLSAPEGKVLLCQGEAEFGAGPPREKLDLESLRRQTRKAEFDSADVYGDLAKLGASYGPAYRAITAIRLGKNRLMALIELPGDPGNPTHACVLDPTVMECALQAAAILVWRSTETGDYPLPFALEALHITSPCANGTVASVRMLDDDSGGHVMKLAVELADQQGNVCVQLLGLSYRLRSNAEANRTGERKSGVLMAVPVWRPGLAARVQAELPRHTHVQRTVLLCDVPHVDPKAIEQKIPVCRSLRIQAPEGLNVAERYTHYALGCFEAIRGIFERDPRGSAIVQIVTDNGSDNSLLIGLSGLLKTAALENPGFMGQVILTGSATRTAELACHLQEEEIRPDEPIVRYERGKRYILTWQRLQGAQAITCQPFKEHGVYLITGGLGGLGTLLAEEILEQTTGARVILAGRSAPSVKTRSIAGNLTASAGRVDYVQADVSNLHDVESVVATITREHRRLSGIIHCAGITADNLIVDKDTAEFGRVLAPKVSGTFNLDSASRDIAMDFFVLFSSISGATGNPRQADYAAANGFMDQYAAFRNQLVASGKRHGLTLSINWPLWRNGGMRIEKASEELLRRATGMVPMQTQTGMHALYRGLELQDGRLLIMEGDTAGVDRFYRDSMGGRPAHYGADVDRLKRLIRSDLRLESAERSHTGEDDLLVTADDAGSLKAIIKAEVRAWQQEVRS